MMRRMICLVLTLAFLLALAACGGGGKEETSQTEQETTPAASPEESEPSSSESPEPQQPPREPIGDPAVITYPKLLLEDLLASPLYQQALERPSVIVCQGEIITDPQPVYDFLAAVEKGEDRDLYYYDFGYDFYGTPDVSFRHFISDSGVVTARGEVKSGWDRLNETSTPYRIARLELNDYGYLTYHDVSDNGFQVVSDRDLYDNVEEGRQMKETYLYPIYYTGIGQTWSFPGRPTPLIYLFEDIYYYENEDTPWDRFGSDWPVDHMVETLSRYFDGISAEDLTNARKFGAEAYDPQTNTIHYEGGRGGAYPPVRVTGWSRDGDILSIDYECYDYYSGIPFENDFLRLTVRLLEDGSFRYLSNLER